MPKLTEEYSRIVNRIYATREEVIQSLMQRAEEGRSRYTVDQMRAEIDRRIKSTELTADEQAVLADLKAHATSDSPRSVMMLNALARDAEKSEFLATGTAPTPTRFVFAVKPATHPAPYILQ